jgi:GAF domain-containing protein
VVDSRLTALCDLGQKLILLRDARQIAETVLEIAARVLDFQDSDFLLVNEARTELYVTARRGQLESAGGLRLPLDGEQGITVAAARSGRPVYVSDVRQDPRYVYTGFSAVSELAVPVQIEDRVLGVLNVESAQPDAFSREDQELLSILAAQAALGLENARLYAEERRQAEEMHILNELSRRISASLDLQATLDAIVAAAAELIPCALAEVSLWDEQSEMLTLQALRCEPDRAYPIGKTFPPGEGYTNWLVRHRQPLLVPDVDARQDIRPHLLPGERPFQAYAGAPLLAGEDLIGTLVLVANEAGAFGLNDVRLLQALADQAAVAIRNARLYEEVTRRHGELAALYAVAEAANRPPDLESLLQHALDRVIKVTHAHGGAIRLLDPTSHEIVLTAHRGLSEAYVQQAGRFPISQEIVGWVARTAEPTLSEDMWTDPRVSSEVRELLKEVGHRALAQVPLRAQEQVVGTLGVVARDPGFFNEDDLKLLNAIGQQLGVAIANAQLFEETERKARRLAALNAVAAAINQSLDLETLLANAVARVVQVVGADAGGVRLLDPQSDTLTFVYHQGLSAGYAAAIETVQLGVGTAGRVASTGEPILIADMWTRPASRPHIRAALVKEGLRARAEVPLRSQKRVVGTLGVVSRTPGAFGAEDVDLLTAIGHQLGVAIENARLRQEALAAERLAAVGRVATSVAHNLRSPLGGILRSAEFLARPELSPGTQQKLSQAIVSLARRLINTSQEILDYVQRERLPLRRTPCLLAEFLDEVLAVLEVDFSDQGIEVARDCRYGGPVVMDSDRMAQVVYNIAANARDAMPHGGTFTVATQKAGERVEMRFTDTGPGVPTELGDRIFEPFFSYGKREGAGLGLAIARRIVEEHSGELGLESHEGQGATFVISLPL